MSLSGLVQGSIGRIRLLYIAALLLIAGVAVWKYVATNAMLHTLESSGTEIDVAGRQRMLSQKISKAALKFDHALNQVQAHAAHDELVGALDLFTRSHHALRTGTQIDGRDLSPPPPAIDAAYDDLQPYVDRIAATASDLLAWDESYTFSKTHSSDVRAAIDEILATERVYLPKMHAIVGMYSTEAKGGVAAIDETKLVLLVVTLVVLVLEALVVFEPAIRRLRAQIVEVEGECARAERLAKAKSDFLANMSHEIRTPMTAIMGYSDLLLEPGMTPQQQSSSVSAIRRSGRHLLSVINDVLDMSKIEAGQLRIESVAIEPAEVLRDVLSVTSAAARAKGLAFHAEALAEIPCTVEGDALRMRQILVNLIGNALKFTEDGGVSVEIGFDDRDGEGWLAIAVRDTGIGISPEGLGSIFTPFTQAENSTTRRYGGTGLGLSISRRLAEQMGGELKAESREGEGSTFTLTIPVGPTTKLDLKTIDLMQVIGESSGGKPSGTGRDDAAAVAAAAGTSGEDGAGRPPGTLDGLRVLLVDDAEDNRRLLSHHLGRAGAAVETRSDGRQAVDRMIDPGCPTVDLLLIDMQMPELDGPTAISELRRRGCTVPMLIITANVMPEDRQTCERAGADEVLTKPITAEVLIGSVRRWADEGPGASRAA